MTGGMRQHRAFVLSCLLEIAKRKAALEKRRTRHQEAA